MAICGFGLLGPYSLLGGAGSIDVGGRRTAAVAAGLVDGIGYLLGPLFGSLGVASLIQRLGWNAAFVALACASLVSVVAAYFFLRATRPKPTTAASV
jgi:OPA family glycerol-3-phosphate transporter-like MFS transporter